ncbi:serine/threonine-protein kinase 11-interacting protein-like [Pomacea canaliculata]|nr:serine/threonine-protein kinase 11-interacting protein-like [Pomacea canaliculata]
MRSNAFISDYNHSEGPQEHIFPHNLSSLTFAEHGFQIQHSLAPSGILHSPYMEDTNIIYDHHADSDLEKAGSRVKVSSAESDITILHKPDSVANLSTCSFPGKDSESVLKSSLTEFPDMLNTVDRAGDLENSNRLNSKSATEEKIFSLASPTPTKDPAKAENTPIGTPLSSSICSSMVSSIYQNSLQPSASTTASDTGSITNRGVVSEGEINTDLDEDRINTDWSSLSLHKHSVTSEVDVLAVEEVHTVETLYSETPETDGCDSKEYDFDRLDHRITLYLMMNKFDNNEEFRFKVKVFVSQYMVEDEWEALLIATNMKLYVFRINDSDISEDPSTALTCRDIQPLGELKQVASGLGQQTVRLEFVTDCSSYTLIFRDKEKTQAFMQRLCDHLTMYAMETSLPMTTVFIEDVDQATLENLKSDVLTRSGRVESLRLYTLGYIARGHNLHSPMAFVMSSSEICLVRTNHQWPTPRYQAPVTVDTVGKQFVVLERQKINNIATLTWHSDNTAMMRITFFNEKSGEEGSWIITMETEKCVMQMIEAIRQPWEEEFAVNMDVEIASFELSF